MSIINIHQAKTHLSELVQKVERGEEITIGRAGRPVARLVPIKVLRRPRRPGTWAGKVRIAKDFDALPSELIAAFSGKNP